jgi:hypothetical protein
MTDHFDEFSKSLADKSVPRRQSLRLLGAALAGALLSPLGVRTAWAGGRDPCKAFCRCSGKSRQDACLAACRACNSDTTSLCGSCASGYVCTDLAGDLSNCGSCGHVCAEPGPYEDGACVDGHCFYSCAQGAADCGDGGCTDLLYDRDHCGACGNVCPPSAHVCDQGVCICPSGTVCDGECIDIHNDPDNCGACGNVCPSSAPHCRSGACFDCAPGLTWCQLLCVDLLFNNYNCGACNHQCPTGTACSFGTCVGSGGGD